MNQEQDLAGKVEWSVISIDADVYWQQLWHEVLGLFTEAFPKLVMACSKDWLRFTNSHFSQAKALLSV